MVCDKRCSEGHTFEPPCEQAAQTPAFTLNEALVSGHEWYQGLRKAGFGRAEALWLTAAYFKGGPPLPDWIVDWVESHKPDPAEG